MRIFQSMQWRALDIHQKSDQILIIGSGESYNATDIFTFWLWGGIVIVNQFPLGFTGFPN